MPNGTFTMDNLTNNILTDYDMPLINNGTGKYKITDIIQDKWNNPINEVQVNVFNQNDIISDENIKAQDYTNGEGKYTLFLNPGTYIFEYYHPNFNVITELKQIGVNGEVITLEDSRTSGTINVHNNTTDTNKNYYLQTGMYFIKSN